jgi:membrane peptidoglycan carboxypeptidase
MDNRPRRSPKRMTTRSGRELKVNRSLGERFTVMKEAKSFRKSLRMAGKPKTRIKKILWYMEPKRLAEYWFSRDGAIMALKIAGIAILVFFVMTLGVFAFFRKDLPNIKDISGGNLGGSISYYDRTGQVLLWQDYNAVKRVPVPSNDISQNMKDATVAVEDRDFYKHRGFDVKGIGRAAVNDFIRHGSTQGGSTITQQLVKLNQDWTQQRSITRKVKELILAVELERTYTKDEILTGYLNTAPYGGVDHGVQAAASDYFHKSAKDLTLAQAAMLATIPKAPAIYSPYSGDYFNKAAFTARQHYVLDVMVQTHKITQQQADQAKKEDVLAEVQPRQNDKYAGIKSPYFVLAAKNEIEKRFTCTTGAGCNKIGGWKVITTMDTKLQAIAEQKVKDNYNNAARAGADEEALVAEDVKTGQMVALVGGTDFNNPDHGQINYAQTPIPPGSSFKPYDYVSLLDNTTNSGAGAVLYDVQQKLEGYPCTDKAQPTRTAKGGNCLWDYDYKYPGPLTLRYALGGSRNVPAVKAMLTVGTAKTIKTANSLMNAPDAYGCYADAKLTIKAPCYGASAIGDGAFLHLDQHVNGLASLARMGAAIPNTYITEIYKAGSKKPFYKFSQPKPKQAVRDEAAYIVDDMASDGNASYLPSGYYKFQSYKGWRIAVKTGTTNDNFDGLMTAWTTKYAVASWVGHHSRQVALRSGGMEFLTTPLTRGFITSALDAEGGTPVNWQQPAGIKRLPAYVVRNHVGVGSIEPSPSTDIFPSWYQQKTATNQTQTIDKVSGKQATTCTPALAKQVLGGNAAANSFSADVFYGATGSTTNGSNANATGSDDVHSCSDSPPSVASVFIDGTDVTGGGSANCKGSCTITTTVNQGSHPFSDPQYPQYPGTVSLLVNGQSVQSKNVADSPSTVTFTYSGSGAVTMAINVVDSVLYDSTSTAATVTMAGGGDQNNGNNDNTPGGRGGGDVFDQYCADHPNSRICRESGFIDVFGNALSLFLKSYLKLF